MVTLFSGGNQLSPLYFVFPILFSFYYSPIIHCPEILTTYLISIISCLYSLNTAKVRITSGHIIQPYSCTMKIRKQFAPPPLRRIAYVSAAYLPCVLDITLCINRVHMSERNMH